MPPIDLTQLALLLTGAAFGFLAAVIGCVRYSRNRRLLWQAEWRARASQLSAETDVARALLEKSETRLRASQEENDGLHRLVISLKERHARLEVLLDEERRAHGETAGQTAAIEQRLLQATRAMAADALQANQQQFLSLARSTLERYLEGARGEMDRRGQALDATLQPLHDTLRRYQDQLRALEHDRDQAYGGLRQQLQALSESQQHLKLETGRLARALRVPHVRGRWGEITLRRVVELAGMQDRCDFLQQHAIADGALRPDMLVQLPGARCIAVDAKVPLGAYLDALEADGHQRRDELMAAHARQVQAHIVALSQKAYWQSLGPSPEFVVLFIPGENFFSAALSQDATLIEKGAGRGVLLATPTTLIALLRTVALTWREHALSENARGIHLQAGELIARLAGVAGHLRDLGRALDRCAESYQRMRGSFERRVLSAARRLTALGVGREADAARMADPEMGRAALHAAGPVPDASAEGAPRAEVGP